ncbi:MAG: hypothetical protein HUK24_07915, partial [Sphaerochaetaceae bacterium]|nr:hypothetical protein [Sphaerochaetaceae bacterium]
MPAWLIIVICVVAFLLIGGVIFTYIYCGLVAKHVYEGTLVRTSPEKWARACSAPDNEEHFDQWNRGLKWAEQFKDKMVEVEIENDGLHLYGEYFDFGGKEAV